jgi:hypothetical protein
MYRTILEYTITHTSQGYGIRIKHIQSYKMRKSVFIQGVKSDHKVLNDKISFIFTLFFK